MRVWVNGANGSLGRALVARGLPGWTRAQLDVTDLAAVDRALEATQPDAVIFCAAISEVDRCENDPLGRAVNTEAAIAWARRVPTWYVSTNYVFGGPGPHAPGDPTTPVNAYGRLKAEAEEGVLAAGGHVVRVGWLCGEGGKGFGSTLAARLAVGPVRALRGWPVQPTDVVDLAAEMEALPKGISHMIGREDTTWAEVARAVAARMGVPERVIEVDGLDLGPRPADARLCPATLPGWSERVERLLAIGGQGA